MTQKWPSARAFMGCSLVLLLGFAQVGVAGGDPVPKVEAAPVKPVCGVASVTSA